MNKLLALLLALAMLLSLAACGSSASIETNTGSAEGIEEDPAEEPVEAESESAPDEDLCGGWTLPEDFTAVTLPEDVQSAFETAMEGFTGSSIEPAALLAEQAVAGVNYAILCRCTPVVPDTASYWVIVFIYMDLDGGAKLLGMSDLPLADYTHTDSVTVAEALQGGWGVLSGTGPSMADEVQEVFDRLPETDQDYHAIALLGTQVVAGTNYAILTVSGDGSMESPYQLTVLTVYRDLNGSAELVSACDLNITDFADFY